MISLKGFYDLREILNKNSVEIQVSDQLEKNKVDVLWMDEFKNFKKIVRNGKETGVIYKEYGRNKFAVTYEQDTAGIFEYFKLNNWHGHKHIIRLIKNDSSEKIECNVEIFGPDAKNK